MKWSTAFVIAFSVFVVGIGAFALLGHMLDRAQWYTWSGSTAVGMSRPTATVTVLMGFSILILAWNQYATQKEH